jgi:hypothetical protein
MQESDSRLKPKDLINIGIFTAIYFIVAFTAGMIGYIPIFVPLQSVVVPLVGGIPMMIMPDKGAKIWRNADSNHRCRPYLYGDGFRLWIGI